MAKRSISHGEPALKKRNINVQFDLTRSLNDAIAAVLAMTSDATGESILALFLKVPPRKIYPDYYTIVSKPIAIQDIQKNITRGKYSLKDEFVADFRLMLDNALTYNDPESWIANDARKIYDKICSHLSNMSPPQNQPPKLTIKLKPSLEKPLLKPAHQQQPLQKPTHQQSPQQALTELSEACIQVLDELINHEFPEEGILSPAFMDNVDVKMYPDYAQIVSHPTSFNNVKNLINNKKLFNARQSDLENLQKFHDETMLIFTNAQLYNDPSAIVYQDSERLQELFASLYANLLDKMGEIKSRRKGKLAESDLLLDGSAAEDANEDETGPSVGSESDDGIALDTNNELDEDFDTRSPQLLPLRDLIIQELSIASALSVAQQILQISQKGDIRSQGRSKGAEVKQSLFPTHPPVPMTTFFEYKVPANGVEALAYTIVLPPDVLPFVSFKVSLHNLVYAVKKADMVNGRGSLSSLLDEDFQCKLFVNEESVYNGGTCYEDKRSSKRAEMLGLQYDIRLCHGLNILQFECKVAPALSRKIKSVTTQQAPQDESLGRHTRHQLQQMKATWDVERITFYVVCNAL